jgi:hypothetical protein
MSHIVREFLKVACVLILGAAVIIAAIAWADDRPNATTWMFRWGPIPFALAALFGFLKIHFAADLVPDFLYRECGTYFDRAGLCFVVFASEMDGVCFLNALFQNRYEGACEGTIVLRHSKGLFGRREFDTIAFRVDCDGGAFGIVGSPISVPAHLQGKTVSFEVGASAIYPSGKGRQLRFRDGIVLRADAQFNDVFSKTATIVGALGGAIIISSPAKAKLRLPINVTEYPPEEIESRQEILWRPGDEINGERARNVRAESSL